MIKNWLITGDTHGLVNSRLKNINTEDYVPEETVVIILGDMGLNFYLNKTDTKNKKAVNSTGFHIYAVRGNHEERPENLGMERDWDMNVQGPVYFEPEFTNIRYFVDGGEYIINGLSTLVIGGAYSVDKWYRLFKAGYSEEEANLANPKKCGWFKDEQLTKEEMKAISTKCKGKNYDLILTHTCPISWEPIDLFLGGVDQKAVDKSMELWLDKLKKEINWKVWLFGHYHADRIERPRVEMFFNDIEDLNVIWERWNSNKELDWWLIKSPNYYFNEV